MPVRAFHTCLGGPRLRAGHRLESTFPSWGDPKRHVETRRKHEQTMHITDKQKPVGYIFRAWITVKGEKRLAKDYGLKAWRIPIYR